MSISERLANSLGLDDFNKRHKIAFGLLCVSLVAIVTLWVVQLRRNIVNPLYPEDTAAPVATAPVSDDAAALKTKDTDVDGLNDWDEINLYKTSAYLKDTDSDGFNDKEEIASGNDPNCPQGKQCATALPTPTSTAAPSAFSNPDLTNLLNASGSAPTETATPAPTPSGLTQEEKDALLKAVGANPDAATLRATLLQAGLDKGTLDALSDADLLAAFKQLSN